MAKLSNFLDFVKNEARNLRLHILASAPSSPVEGQVYHNTTSHHPEYHNGTTFVDITDALTLGGQNSAFHRARANHTGTQLAATISDFDNQVRTSRLDQMAAPSASVSFGSQKLTNVLDGVAASDVATVGQVQSLINTGANKTAVKGASTANLAVASALVNGLVHDGITYATGDRILLKNQTAPAENGIWIIAASGAASRATDADISAEVKGGLAVWVNEGGQGDTRWVLTTNDPIVLGTTGLTFIQDFAANATTAGAGLYVSGAGLAIGTVSTSRIVVNGDDIDLAQIGTPGTYRSVTVDAYGRVTAGTNPATTGKYSALIGDNSATTFNITAATHGLAADRTLVVQVLEESTGIKVLADVSIGATGTVTVAFSVAPTANQYRVTILG